LKVRLFSKDTGLFYLFEKGGKKEAVFSDPFGQPFQGDVIGRDFSSGFNSIIGTLLLMLCKTQKWDEGCLDADTIFRGIRSSFRDQQKDGVIKRFMYKGDDTSVVNDAFVSGFYLLISFYKNDEGLKREASMLFKKIINNYRRDGNWACCFIDGKASDGLLTRDALLPGYLAWAGMLLKDEGMVNIAEEVVKKLIRNDYDGNGILMDCNNPGTNSEFALSLLSMYQANGKKEYLKMAYDVIKGFYTSVNNFSDNLQSIATYLLLIKRYEVISGKKIEFDKNKIEEQIISSREKGNPFPLRKGEDMLIPVLNLIVLNSLF